MKKTFFTILLVGFFLGCTTPQQDDGGSNSTYMALGIDSFYSDAPDVSSGGISDVKLSVTNYGSDPVRNVYAKLLGAEGQDIEITSSYYSAEEIMPGESTEFFWVMDMPVLSVQTDVVYVFDARVYFDYETNSSREVVFMPDVQAPTVTTHSSSTEGPVSVSLTTLEPVRMDSDETETEFTATVRIQNADQGYVGYIDGDGNEITGKDNYIDSIFIVVPTSWALQHPEDWTASSGDECNCEAGYTKSGNTCSIYLEEAAEPCPDGSHLVCQNNVPWCSETEQSPTMAPEGYVSHSFCPAGYLPFCDMLDVTCTYSDSYDIFCPNPGELVMSLKYDYGDQDTRMRLVRGDHTTYSVGFVRANVQSETVESITAMVRYSYYIPTLNSVDVTVRGQQQTY